METKEITLGGFVASGSVRNEINKVMDLNGVFYVEYN